MINKCEMISEYNTQAGKGKIMPYICIKGCEFACGLKKSYMELLLFQWTEIVSLLSWRIEQWNFYVIKI